MADQVEQPLAPTTFVPSTDLPVEAADDFDALQAALGVPSDLDLIVAADESQPVGRTWAMDWIARQFIGTETADGPVMLRGDLALEAWVEKCLRTARGAHPVHPPGYGLAALSLGLIGGPVGVVPPDLESKIEDALQFHPNIDGIADFNYDYDPDDPSLQVSFTILLANGDQQPVSNVKLNVGL